MIPEERESQENINREQQDDAQVLDASDMERRDDTNISSGNTERGGAVDPSEVAPDDRADLVETMDAMVASGHIDNGAFDGERVDDDEEDMLGTTNDEDEGEGLSLIEDDDAMLGTSEDGNDN